jgi:hypothetical protein
MNLNKKALDRFTSFMAGNPCRVCLLGSESEIEIRVQDTCELGILAKDGDTLIFLPYSSIVYLSEKKKTGKKD